MPLYDFTCYCGYKIELITPPNQYTIVCPKCNKLMNREFPLPIILTSDRRAFRMVYDPVTGENMSKDEIKQLKNTPYPKGSDYAKEHGLVGKK